MQHSECIAEYGKCATCSEKLSAAPVQQSQAVQSRPPVSSDAYEPAPVVELPLRNSSNLEASLSLRNFIKPRYTLLFALPMAIVGGVLLTLAKFDQTQTSTPAPNSLYQSTLDSKVEFQYQTREGTRRATVVSREKVRYKYLRSFVNGGVGTLEINSSLIFEYAAHQDLSNRLRSSAWLKHIPGIGDEQTILSTAIVDYGANGIDENDEVFYLTRTEGFSEPKVISAPFKVGFLPLAEEDRIETDYEVLTKAAKKALGGN